MSSKSKPVKKQKRTASQAGKAVAASVLFAAAEELLANKSVVEPQLLPDLSDAPVPDAAAEASPLSAAEAVAVDVPMEDTHAAAPAESAELADLLAELAQDDGGADLAASLEEPVLLADAGAAADDVAVAQAAPEAAPAPAGAEALAPAAEVAAPISVPLAVVGGLGVIGVGAALGGGSSSRPLPTSTPAPTDTPAPTHEVSGRVVDGPVQHARVFYDADGDGVWDDVNGNGQWDQGDELFAFTDDNGFFNIPGITLTPGGRLMVEAGGTDSETGNAVGALLAPLLSNNADNLVISPLTMVLALNPTLTQAELKAALGLPADVNLLSFDPFAAMEGEDETQAALGVEVFAAQQQLYSLVRALTEVAAGSDNQLTLTELQAALTAVGEAIEAGGTRDAIIQAAVQNLASNETVQLSLTGTQLTQITNAIQDSAQAIEEAYTATSPSGLNLASARALVEAGDASAPHFAEAVALLASARAAASVSQTTLVDVVDNVSSGNGTYTDGGLQDAIDEETEHYTDEIADEVTPTQPPVTSSDLTDAQVAAVTNANTGGNAALDELVALLHSQGVEHIRVDDSQITTLAGSTHDLAFAPGTDLVVSGTSFLGGAVAGEDVQQLLGAADVAVTLDAPAMAAVLQGDGSLDSVVQRLQDAGMDRLQLTAAQVNELALDSDHLTLNAGVQVDITSAFVTAGPGKANAEQVSSLLGEADVTVHLDQSDLLRVQWGGNEALDNIVSTLAHAGMDTLALDAAQVTALAHNGNHIAAGTDVLVTGTSFLASAVSGGADPATLLSAADVAVALTGAEVTAVAGRSDASLDDLVDKLQAAGMDTLQLDAGQVRALAQAQTNLSLDAGTAVNITSDFVGSGTPAAFGALLQAADVTVQLSQQDVAAAVAGGNGVLADMVSDLHQAGMDVLALDQHEVSAMAQAGLHLAGGTDVSVTGTHFLSTAGDGELTSLLGDAHVTAHLTGTDLGQILAGTTTNEDLDALTSHLSAVGVDALALDAGQALELAYAAQNFTLNSDLDIELDHALTLTQATNTDELAKLNRLLADADVTAKLDIADLRQLHLDSTEALGETLSTMEEKLDDMGVDKLEISDELADALAEAGVRFMASHDEPAPIVGNSYFGQDVVVRAQADEAGGDTAYLQASLHELQQLGVDHVVGAGGVTHIGLAMSNSNGTSPNFTLADLPSFEPAANVDLVITDADLMTLLDGTAEDIEANLQALSDAHVDRLLLTGSNMSAEAMHEHYGTVLQQMHLTAVDTDLTQAQVQLLGLGNEPGHTLDPFNKHPTQS